MEFIMRRHRILRAVMTVLRVATAPRVDPAHAFGWATVWQAVKQLALEVAAGFLANEASKMLHGDEVASLKQRLATQVEGHYETAPS
jgi:hypothetical protein